MSVCCNDIKRHFQHVSTYIYESIYTQGFILLLLSWFLNLGLLLDQSMCHKEPRGTKDLIKDQFLRQESQK